MNRWFLGVLIPFLLAVPAYATPIIVSNLSAGLVQTTDKGQVIAPVSALKPGEIVAYTAVYSNKGDAAAGNMEVKLPVPEGTVYLRDGTQPAGALASSNGSDFAPIPPAGSKDEAKVLASYRDIEWSIGTLSPGQSKTVRIFVKVLPTP